MIRMSKLTDYGIVLMTELARAETGANFSARELSRRCHLPTPVVSKILKVLTRRGLLNSFRGTKGGYSLARAPNGITVGEVIHAVEGPIAMTECVDTPGDCTHESVCPVRTNWERINSAVDRVLHAISLEDMLQPLPNHLVPLTGVSRSSDALKPAVFSD